MPMGARLPFLIAAAALFAGGCGREEGGEIALAFIEPEAALFAQDPPLSAGARLLRAATHSSLVALNAQGEVIPDLADQWIVTGDGKSYIFRLRDGQWPDGGDITAESARAALTQAIDALEGTALGLDLEQIDEIRAMAGRVVEIRLKSPMPDFLQLLTAPELAVSPADGGSGPMRLERDEEIIMLRATPPQEDGLPGEEDREENLRPIALLTLSAERAVAQFDDGVLDVVLGGNIGTIPLVETGPLSRGTVRLDPAIGLFGLRVERERGLLASAAGREAIAMAIDRAALLAPYGVGGWNPTSRIVAAGVTHDLGTIAQRWDGLTMEERRAEATRRVAAWRTADLLGLTEGTDAAGDSVPQEPAPFPTLAITLPQGPGYDILYRALTQQLATIGISLERVGQGEEADLSLVDRVARYAGARWFLNQFNCSLRQAPCAPEADERVRESLSAEDAASRAALLAEAEAELTAANIYIPLSGPLRWSLVRGSIEGFAPNAWAFHPLPAIAGVPR